MISMVDTSNLLCARLAALSQADGSLLFQETKIGGSKDLAAELEKIYGFSDRMAILVPDGTTYRSAVQGYTAIFTATHHLVLLLSDRDVGDPNNALVGRAESPGVLGMVESVVQELAGINFDLWGRQVLVRPTEAIPFTITRDAQMPGRKAYEVDLEVDAGTIKKTNNRKS